ncbi:MAG: hypothetical protein UT30_C0008G0043 [Candidatus Uhrbacteria bacterium GW2011_GWF2_39_13]|uniref:Polymerase/histidinol phosphatase N-terminal domain-containing protein n=1 Tax=Candidatus Uhrbacteria bacterium GW2011_GWF2_39_13 TaxID=1618995 RepID=A0A0G0MVE8_9BACT|nr:MAG: hypothetical protein UT30_C0008G0043 [Candidatus Uhrbacteria bacterium GW2011_GWF2_39_13]
MRILSDLHIHTSASPCCHDKEQTIENITEATKNMGLKKIGFADHVWVSDMYKPSGFYNKQSGEEHLKLKEIAQSRDWGIEVLVGCEADMIAPGKFGITDDFKRQMDYVLLSSDHFHMKDFVEQPENSDSRTLGRHMLKFFISAAESGMGDILAHPFFPYGFIDMYDTAMASISDAELFDACAVAAAKNTGIEINPCYLPNAAKNRFFSIETPVRFLAIAKEAGCKFTFGSDAHGIKELEAVKDFQYFIDALGLQAKDIHDMANIADQN